MNETHPELSALAGRLRALVAERRYTEAQGAFEVYCGVLRKTLAGLQPGDPALRRLEDEWRRLLEETRRRMLAGRAHASARLAQLVGRRELSQLYGDHAQHRHTWEYSG